MATTRAAADGRKALAADGARVKAPPGAKPAAPGAAAPAAHAAISFTIAVDGERPRRFRIAPSKRPVKVGRHPKNDIILNYNGVSGHHLDIMALRGEQGPVLAVRDASMNGTGLQSGPGLTPLRLAKDASVTLLSASVLLLPFKVKPAPGQSDESLRAILRVSVVEEAKRALKPAMGLRGAAKKRKFDQVAKASIAKKPNTALVEDMMARCKAFAVEMESKRLQDEQAQFSVDANALARATEAAAATNFAAWPPPPPPLPPQGHPAPPMPPGSTGKATFPQPPQGHTVSKASSFLPGSQQRPPAPNFNAMGADAVALQQMQMATAMQGQFKAQLAAQVLGLQALGFGGYSVPPFGGCMGAGAAVPRPAASGPGSMVPQMVYPNMQMPPNPPIPPAARVPALQPWRPQKYT